MAPERNLMLAIASREGYPGADGIIRLRRRTRRERILRIPKTYAALRALPGFGRWRSLCMVIAAVVL